MGRRTSLLPLVILPGVAVPCCLAFNSQTPMFLSSEKAIIVWDDQKGVEHFVREAAFAGDAKDFGFIVPAPSEPEVAVAKASAFETVDTYVATRLFEEAQRRSKAGTPEAGALAAGGAEVIAQYRVGDYEASILKAEDGASMLAWLKENRYTNRPAMEEWLDHYAKKGWYFAALKFVREKGSKEPKTTAVRVSFATEQPFYPYKMPSDTWPKGHFRPIQLYYIARDEYKGDYEGDAGQWPARKIWSGQFKGRELREVFRDCGLDPMTIGSEPRLTAFSNSRTDEGFDRDLHFTPVPKPNWLIAGVGGALGAAVVGYGVRKLRPAGKGA